MSLRLKSLFLSSRLGLLGLAVLCISACTLQESEFETALTGTEATQNAIVAKAPLALNGASAIVVAPYVAGISGPPFPFAAPPERTSLARAPISGLAPPPAELAPVSVVTAVASAQNPIIPQVANTPLPPDAPPRTEVPLRTEENQPAQSQAPISETGQPANEATTTAKTSDAEQDEAQQEAEFIEPNSDEIKNLKVHIPTIDEILANARGSSFSDSTSENRTLLTYASYAVASAHIKTTCFPSALKAVFRKIQNKYGVKPVVNSGYRGFAYNQNVGGTRNSYHLKCQAADIKVPGVDKAELAAFLRSLPNIGGVGTYGCNTIVHVDTGDRRDWHYTCRSRRRSI